MRQSRPQPVWRQRPRSQRAICAAAPTTSEMWCACSVSAPCDGRQIPYGPSKEGVVDMAEQTCPNCGAEVPRETGQHATAPSAGVVQCPTCGASVTLDKPGADADHQAVEASG